MQIVNLSKWCIIKVQRSFSNSEKTFNNPEKKWGKDFVPILERRIEILSKQEYASDKAMGEGCTKN